MSAEGLMVVRMRVFNTLEGLCSFLAASLKALPADLAERLSPRWMQGEGAIRELFPSELSEPKRVKLRHARSAAQDLLPHNYDAAVGKAALWLLAADDVACMRDVDTHPDLPESMDPPFYMS
jgi:hypothetical protein